MSKPILPDRIVIQREEEISVPPSKNERRIAIRQPDWLRIKRRLSHAMAPVSRLSVVYGFLFGFGGSSVVSMVQAVSEGQAFESISLCAFIAVVSFLVGVLLVGIERKVYAERTSALTDILEDINDIEIVFQDSDLSDNRG